MSRKSYYSHALSVLALAVSTSINISVASAEPTLAADVIQSTTSTGLFSQIESSVGILLMVLAFNGAVICVLSKSYRAAFACFFISLGVFGSRELIALIYGSKFQGLNEVTHRGFELANDGRGVIPAEFAWPIMSFLFLICLALLTRALYRLAKSSISFIKGYEFKVSNDSPDSPSFSERAQSNV